MENANGQKPQNESGNPPRITPGLNKPKATTTTQNGTGGGSGGGSGSSQPTTNQQTTKK